MTNNPPNAVDNVDPTTSSPDSPDILEDTEPDLNRKEIHQRAKSGIKMLMGRHVFIQGFTLAGGIVLARILTPAEFGLFTIATFFIQVCAVLCDFGVAPSLIQQKKEITDRDLGVAFTMQQCLVAVIVFLLFLGAPLFAKFYNLGAGRADHPVSPTQLVWLARVLALNLFLTSLRTMSMLQLERSLQYKKVAGLEVVETLLYQGVTVVMALLGFGVWSFIIATFCKSITGNVILFRMVPWRAKPGFDREIAKGMMKFGIPFQISKLVHSAIGWVSPALVGALVGPAAVGYIGFSTSNGRKPLMLCDAIMRVSFPHFSRIQDDQPEVERVMVRYLTYLLIVSGLWSALMLTAGPHLISLVYSKKWNPAAPAFMLYAVAANLEVIAWVVGETINSLGRSDLAMRRALLRTGVHIALSIPLILHFGFVGQPIAYLTALFLTMPIQFVGLRPGAMRRILAPVMWLLVPMTVATIAGIPVTRTHYPELATAVATVTVVAAVYLLLVVALAPSWLKTNMGRKIPMLKFRTQVV